MPDLTHHNEPSRAMLSTEPDAHGQAALLLAESMIHALVESGVFSRGVALSVVETAAEVKEEFAERTGESSERMGESLQLLARIEESLRVDMI